MAGSVQGSIEAAKADILRCMGEQPWLRGVGIGLIVDAPGIVISVESSGADAARSILSELQVDVPTRIQVLGPVRKRG